MIQKIPIKIAKIGGRNNPTANPIAIHDKFRMVLIFFNDNLEFPHLFF